MVWSCGSQRAVRNCGHPLLVPQEDCGQNTANEPHCLERGPLMGRWKKWAGGNPSSLSFQASHGLGLLALLPCLGIGWEGMGETSGKSPAVQHVSRSQAQASSDLQPPC